MSNRIPDDRIRIMQQSADTGLHETGLILLLAEHVNDLLDERPLLLAEIGRLTRDNAERSDELVRMATDRDSWRVRLEAVAAGLHAVVASPHRGERDAASEVRKALLAMEWFGPREACRATIRGVAVRRLRAATWVTANGLLYGLDTDLDSMVALILAHAK